MSVVGDDGETPGLESTDFIMIIYCFELKEAYVVITDVIHVNTKQVLL